MNTENVMFVLSSILDMMVLMVYFRVVYTGTKKWVTNPIRIGAFFLVYAVSYIIDLHTDAWYVNIPYSVLNLFLLSLLYQSGKAYRVFVVFSFEILAILAELLAVGMVGWLQSLVEGVPILQEESYYYVMFVSKLVLFLIIMCVSALPQKRAGEVPFKYQIYLILIPSLSIGVVLEFYLQTIRINRGINLPTYLSLAGILAVNVIVYYLLENIIEASDIRERQTRMEAQLTIQEQKYQQTTTSFKKISGVIHDTNKHLLYLKECLEKGDREEGVRYAERALGRMEKSYKRIQTGFLVVDALVSNVMNTASAYQIDFKTEIKVEKERIQIDHYDLSVVLGNLLDNAVEACKQMGVGEDKFINVSIHTSEYSLVIHMANSMVKGSVKKHFASSKTDKERHGYGIRNVEAVVEKYGGSMDFDNGERRFDVSVILPLES